MVAFKLYRMDLAGISTPPHPENGRDPPSANGVEAAGRSVTQSERHFPAMNESREVDVSTAD
jgi:hypothetical protein